MAAFRPSSEQQNVIKHRGGHLQDIECAGAGKTPSTALSGNTPSESGLLVTTQPVRYATFITTALKIGANSEEVQDASGHANPSTTRLYDRRGFDPEKSASFFANY